jgi:transcriptional regulator with PAS, ATPase and Fis domain
VIERSLVLANGHDRLGVDDLPPELQGLSISDEVPKGSFHQAVKGFKRELVRSALAMHSGNKLKAAKELGISRCYLHRLLNQLNMIDGRGESAEELREDSMDTKDSAIPPTGGMRAAARIA